MIMHVADMANLRAMYEKGSRDYSGLDLGRSEDASFVVPPTGLSANVARDGTGTCASTRPSATRTAAGSSSTSRPATWRRSRSPISTTRTHTTRRRTASRTRATTPTPARSRSRRASQWNVSGYYTHEKNGSAQINNGTNNFPAIDDFTTR